MKIHLLIAVLFITPFAAMADENTSVNSDDKKQYQECVAVSLYTMQGRELNAIVENDRKIKETNLIPKGWSVIGVTTKKEAGVAAPYMVICH